LQARSSTPGTQSSSIESQAELDKTICELNDATTRLRALSKLVEFARDKIYQIGSVFHLDTDLRIDELKRQAAQVVASNMDRETVSQALESTDRTLQLWGILVWKTGIYEEPSAEISAWLSLMPKVMTLAVEGDETIRAAAVDKLRQCAEAKAFLKERSEVETSAWILLQLVPPGPKGEMTIRVNNLLLHLLHNPDEEVRAKALVLIGFNNDRAPVNQIDFDDRIFNRVIALTHSIAEKERSVAAYALTAIRTIDLEESLKAFTRLSKDPSSEVRWRVGFGLAGLDREDVNAIVDDLVNDSSSLVQVMTISAIGPKKFVEQLKKLASDSDPQVAASAAGMLRRLIQDGMKISGFQ
jgi:hypothetical protein